MKLRLTHVLGLSCLLSLFPFTPNTAAAQHAGEAFASQGLEALEERGGVWAAPVELSAVLGFGAPSGTGAVELAWHPAPVMGIAASVGANPHGPQVAAWMRARAPADDWAFTFALGASAGPHGSEEPGFHLDFDYEGPHWKREYEMVVWAAGEISASWRTQDGFTLRFSLGYLGAVQAGDFTCSGEDEDQCRREGSAEISLPYASVAIGWAL